ncbi:FAD-dependent oxidoreductase [Persicitalea jodogahamensis]|uniref:Xanthan lyase n=1 Tax=Persicitalea jodogahamensis TaxID=402147 RepID=A0A8J3D125_9BACT|nr:FAD-dependent oxidoreductase [Persicitalea jodogahamensis]GHB54265.1 hypothetical protein GCM10007390_04030 [Persicitalea jodogahamensis]
MRIFKKFTLSFLLLTILAACSPNSGTDDNGTGDTRSADVIIYGGTAAAVTAAVQVKKMGKSVIVVSPDKHLGGLSAGGLGFTDTGNKSVIGGLAREFYHRLYQHYQQDSSWKWQQREEFGNKGQGTAAMDGENRTMWIFEPHAAEQVFEDFVKENDITIYRDEWLDRSAFGVGMENEEIKYFKTLSGNVYEGKMFIDATYEGDLMAAAGVSYHVGREANSVYGEQWNGVQTEVFQHKHYFESDISPYKVAGDPSSGLLPEVSNQPPGEYGSGDNKIQAYCFRLCMTDKPENRLPFPKPEGYDPARYELLQRVFDSGWDKLFVKFDRIPNRKTDTNNHGPFSSDYIGKNYDYPEASYERRKEIIEDHRKYQQGLLYFMQNDARMPGDLGKKIKEWGLSKDEFTDNNNWPHQIYVREARRMVGQEVMTEQHTLGTKLVTNSVGMGSYSLDSHNAQRYVKEDGFVQNEGDIGVHPKQPYSISYGSILPKAAECKNLLVPVAMSSSHIAFGSIRMEPVFMILGQSAAAAAVLSIENDVTAQQLPYAKLREVLVKEGQKLEVSIQAE